MKLLRRRPRASKTKVEGSVPSQPGSPMAAATGSGPGASSKTDGSAETWKRRRSRFTSSSLSGRSMLTRSIPTPLAGRPASVLRMRGNSSRQAEHQVAQKWSTAGFPAPARRGSEEASTRGTTRGAPGEARRAMAAIAARRIRGRRLLQLDELETVPAHLVRTGRAPAGELLLAQDDRGA